MAKAESHEKPCPNCGHCPTCGRSNFGPRPWYPVYPYSTHWYQPYWRTYGPYSGGMNTSGSGGYISNTSLASAN